MRKNVILSAALCVVAFPAAAYAQTREVAGRVHEATTGQPVANAAIEIVGQQVGVCTNERGEYRLPAPAGELSITVRAANFEPSLLRLAAGDTVADFVMTRQVAHAPAANEAILVVDGVIVSIRATVAPVSAPSEPLIVVDGVPLRSPAFVCSGGRIQARGAN
jgi:plastocyanin